MTFLALALFSLPIAMAQTACPAVGTTALATSTGAVSTAAPAACVGHIWQPITWSTTTFIATKYQLQKLIQYTPEVYKKAEMELTGPETCLQLPLIKHGIVLGQSGL